VVANLISTGTRGARLRAGLWCVATLLVALAALAGRSARAHAAQYTSYLCRGPHSEPGTMSSWRVLTHTGSSTLESRDGCPTGNPWDLEMSPSSTHPSDEHLLGRLLAPADTTIAAYRLWRSVQLAAGYGWRYRELTPTSSVDLDSCYYNSGCRGVGDPSSAFAKGNRIEVTETALSGLDVVLTCALSDSSTATCGATAPGAIMHLYGGLVRFEDDFSPVIAAAPTGPLVDPARTLSGVEPVSITASDRGGGVYQALFEVDGRMVEAHTIDDNGGACAPPFMQPLPCKLSASGTVTLNTAALSDGMHSLRILVNDATGENVATWGPTTILTANASCSATPVSASLRLQAGLDDGGGRVRHVATVRYGRRLLVTGSLSAPDGAPVGGASVCVIARDEAQGAAFRAYRTVTTDAQGRFTYELLKGASRRVVFVHRAADGAVVGSVVVRVRAPVRLSGSPHRLRNRRTLHMRGRLGARPFPPGGALVELQARRGSGWQTFGTTRTNRRGRFHFDYTFTRTFGVQRYALRARVPAQGVYPFASGWSRPLRVTVAG
jgi:hypothetical protein